MGRFKPQTEEMSLGFWRIRRWRIVAASPAKKARALVDPIVVSDHVVDAREVKADQAEAQTDRVIDEIVMQRQELAFEQGGVKEAHGKAQKKHVEREMPPRSPGGGDRPPGEPGAAPSQATVHRGGEGVDGPSAHVRSPASVARRLRACRRAGPYALSGAETARTRAPRPIENAPLRRRRRPSAGSPSLSSARRCGALPVLARSSAARSRAWAAA